jgi:hypothetical protein
MFVCSIIVHHDCMDAWEENSTSYSCKSKSAFGSDTSQCCWSRVVWRRVTLGLWISKKCKVRRHCQKRTHQEETTHTKRSKRIVFSLADAGNTVLTRGRQQSLTDRYWEYCPHERETAVEPERFQWPRRSRLHHHHLPTSRHRHGASWNSAGGCLFVCLTGFAL